MNIPQIQMRSQRAEIGMRTTAARQSIQQPKADLQIKQPQAEMTIRTVRGKLTIDQSQAWEEMNIKSIRQGIKENADRGKQKLREGIARVVREGDEMVDIRSGRNVIAEQSRRKSQRPPSETVLTYIPSPFAVKYHYEPGKTNIQFDAKQAIIQANTRKPIISHARGDVNIYMKKHQDLQIDLVK